VKERRTERHKGIARGRSDQRTSRYSPESHDEDYIEDPKEDPRYEAIVPKAADS